MKHIVTTINIQAPADKVWQVLTNFEAYPSWNPFIRNIEGNLEAGAVLKITVTPPKSKAMSFRPSVLKYTPNHSLTWLGHFLTPGLFDGEHSFELVRTSNHTTEFMQKEAFKGILVPFCGNVLTKTEQGFILMNRALKQRVESINI